MMYMSCIIPRRKKAGRRQSPQVNIGNRENTMEINSGYESLSSNQPNESTAYTTIASTKMSHPATHDHTGSTDNDYLQPVVSRDLHTSNTSGTVPGVYHNAMPASSSGNTYQSLQPSQAAAAVYDQLQYDGWKYAYIIPMYGITFVMINFKLWCWLASFNALLYPLSLS